MLVKVKKKLPLEVDSAPKPNRRSSDWGKQLAGYFGKVDLDIDLEALRSR